MATATWPILAKNLDNGAAAYTQDGDVVGTPDYLSPEQVRSEPVTPKFDIYSLGLVLYEMLTASHPFPESTPLERMFKQLDEPVPKITSLDQNTSDAINEVIQKATAKNPDQRHTNVVPDVEFSADGRYALTASFDQAAKLWDVATGQELRVLRGHTDQISGNEKSKKAPLF